ncbi:MAG: ComF family protein [Thiomicrospira sp.]|uniref:ComF family protein n=1 Tax=Thiomicrospira sp. TaxID=935 RepID=UPI0019F5AE71|nr:ComF family protein [Thiomicrospira sp.]MBE0493032.1 ComF family protein [Thiomicrospira sp.]
MHWLEKWLFPPTCVITAVTTKKHDLDPSFIAQWQIGSDVCPCCAEPSPQGLLCGQCLSKPPQFSRTQVAFTYQAEFRDLMAQFKYHQRLDLSRLFAELLAPQLHTQGIQAIIPIPLHSTRLRERGYNQAYELARMLSPMLNIPIVSALTRPLATPSQTQLKAKQRRQNLKQAFEADAVLLKDFDRVALLDDVITTGATMQAAASRLQDAQPGLVVEAWAMAKTL